MARLRISYIDVRSRVRTELPGLGSCGPRLYFPIVSPGSNNELLESSKRDTFRLFGLPSWLQLTTLAGSKRAGALFLLLVGSQPWLPMLLPFCLNLSKHVLIAKPRSFQVSK